MLVLPQVVYSDPENKPDIKFLPTVHLEFPVACRTKLLFPDPVTPERIKFCIRWAGRDELTHDGYKNLFHLCRKESRNELCFTELSD
jgi:hypothetical protein